MRKVTDKRAPLTKAILMASCSVLPLVCYNNYEATLFKSLFVLAYFGLFRVSELIAPSNTVTGFTLQYSDVTFDSTMQAVEVKLYTYKTNQRGVPVTIKLPSEDNEPTICPVRATQAFSAIRPKILGAFFCHSSGKPVTRQQLSAVLTKCIAKTTFSSAHYRTHSFRIGRASDLAVQGVPMDSIMKLGRWHSQAYKLYIR